MQLGLGLSQRSPSYRLQSSLQAVMLSPLLLGQQKQCWQRKGTGASWCTAKRWRQIRYGQSTKNRAQAGMGKVVCSPAYQSPESEGSKCSLLPFFSIPSPSRSAHAGKDRQHAESFINWQGFLASTCLCKMANSCGHGHTTSQQSVLASAGMCSGHCLNCKSCETLWPKNTFCHISKKMAVKRWWSHINK